jgi:hypothetical protein
MIIEKRTMNWLPRPSLYKEAEAARLKRRHHAQQAMANQQSIANAFGNLHSVNTQGQVDIAIRVAHARLLANPTRTDKTA